MIDFDIQFAIRLIPLMMQYLKVTVMLSILTMVIGLTIAFIIALITDAKINILSPLMRIYVSFFRGTPLLAQLFLLYFGLAQVFPVLIKLSAFNAALIVLSLNSAAFMSEAIRGAIMSIDKGQMEACLSIGMTYWQAMRRIILPQAIRMAIPALSNSFINIVKSSSLAYTIGVTEMMAMAQLEAASSYRYLEAFVVIILVYWLLISILGHMQSKLELRLNQY